MSNNVSEIKIRKCGVDVQTNMEDSTYEPDGFTE